MARPVPNTNEIKAYLHCAKCLRERPDGVSPAEVQHISAGWTPQGLQIWCNIHDCNILHVDFEDQKHPANTTARDPKPKLRIVN
jgi:hypothetical protein